MKIALAFLLILLLASIIPYFFISLVLWNRDISTWNTWSRLIFAIWTLFLTNSAYSKLRNQIK
jgi:hypothetical protein